MIQIITQEISMKKMVKRDVKIIIKKTRIMVKYREKENMIKFI